MTKSILLTGATGLVGSKLLIHFVRMNYNVCIPTRNIGQIPSLISKLNLEKFASNIFPVEYDFLNYDSESWMNLLRENNFAPHVIIHNARSLSSLKIEEDGTSSYDNLLTEYKMGIVTPYRIIMDIILSELHKNLENIIFISSMYGVVTPNPSLYEDFEKSSPIQYGVVKSAQIHLTKELAVRLAKYNIRVNCISFGGIKGRANNDFCDRYEKLTPLGGMLEQEEVVGPVDFLVSENSKRMTGHNLLYDGGWTLW